jgi:hypothetical protein
MVSEKGRERLNVTKTWPGIFFAFALRETTDWCRLLRFG